MVVSEPRTTRVDAELSDGGEALTIRVCGNFDFNVHREFQQAYQKLSPAPKTYCIDLSETYHLDSAALGMLLLLRDHCLGGDDDTGQRTVELRNANAHVENILLVSNFDKIFAIK